MSDKVIKSNGKTVMHQPWLVWLSGLSAGLLTERLLILFPVRAHVWVVGGSPAGGMGEATDQCISSTLMFLSLSSSLPLSLKISK